MVNMRFSKLFSMTDAELEQSDETKQLLHEVEHSLAYNLQVTENQL